MASRETIRTTLRHGLLWASVGLLAGCGGGGGGDSPPPQPPATVITAANADAVAARGYEIASALFEATDAAAAQLKDADAARPGPGVSVVQLSLAATRWVATGRFGAAGGTAAEVAAKAVQSATVSCPSGGNIASTLDDANADGIPNAGDSASVTFNRCVIEGTLVEGSISFVLQAFTSSAASDSVRAAYTFGNLRATEGGVTSTVNGDMTLSATIANVAPFVSDVTVSGNRLDVSEGGETRTLTSYSGRVTSNDTARTLSYTVSGDVSGSGLPGTLTLSTPTAISGPYGADPTAGVLVVAGANGSSVRLTATPPSGVRLSVDADGDGTPESTRTLTWAQLEAS